MKQKKKGQMVIEILWMLLFILSFLSSVVLFYEKSEKEIQKLRIGENNSYGRYPPSFY